MKEIVVLSGKGGTGKTSIVASLAVLAENKVLADCDVDAADLDILLDPSIQEKHDFAGGKVAFIDSEKCARCNICAQVCRFDAITDLKVDPLNCEGCGFCSHVCPVDAITMQPSFSGNWFISSTKYGPLVHARLGIGQENSGKLVAEVKRQAKIIAQSTGASWIIIDGPPGTGCPVISSLSGASTALLVTEPTLSGVHDLKRIIEVCQHFKVPALVCINKFDINEENTRLIEKHCQSLNISVAAKIPFDTVVTEAMVQGKPVLEYTKGRVSQEIEKLWNAIDSL
ncbi:MAG: ATP-binding protein [Dehalococcoidales bacterium]|nr:ATP-binding protein [Dehalococcoidales bacterium]MDD4230327.1 ATP-binding protein [Dehalococcoidales bacterium]MDD4465319.1 ATP-binding protein [Dehalococcoidales bacterium]MDD5402316.1 ATP-binding protein [Dehalococcoidales bacterium]